MNLSRARLCLDCEELHDELRCPKCGSEAWCYPVSWLSSASYADVSVALAESLMDELCN